jgi:hypothetical protein
MVLITDMFPSGRIVEQGRHIFHGVSTELGEHGAGTLRIDTSKGPYCKIFEVVHVSDPRGRFVVCRYEEPHQGELAAVGLMLDEFTGRG